MIANLFYLLLFAIPLALFPKSSEVFEFNKMVVVYASTVLIIGAWILKMIFSRKVVFRRTILDIPILLFLSTLAFSTFFSIDVRTSVLGYYSRFHGGLLSYFSYSLLYWAYVSNMDAEKTQKSIKFLLASAILVSIYGVLQHFGIDKKVWVQDVQNRIFSTLGQPNWLAAWIVALIPLSRPGLGAYSSPGLGMASLFFLTLLFTKSRSGLLGFFVADLTFWSAAFLQIKRKTLSSFIIHHSLFIILALAIGTPWSPSLKQLISQQSPVNAPALETGLPANASEALQAGGTESGTIRKIVWKGTIDLWKKYPILGTGPETFAFSYYETRPVEHNLVSEWDFLYNKAHNEYLNFLANTGTIGLFTYLILILFSILQISNFKFQNSKKSLDQSGQLEIRSIKLALATGYVSILITNFFGFSVVPVALLFFMFPAMAVSLAISDKGQEIRNERVDLTKRQKILVSFLLLVTGYFLLSIARYWSADFLYAKGKLYNDSEKFATARKFLTKAVKLSPNEAVFWDELSQASAGLVLQLNESVSNDKKKEFSNIAVSQSQRAISLSPRNLNLQRSRASLFLKLASIDPTYLVQAREVGQNAVVYAPTDAKLYYHLGLTTYRLGQTTEALEILDKAIEMKPNYKNARFAKALILVDLGRKKEAAKELTYILGRIDPNDELVKEELKKVK